MHVVAKAFLPARSRERVAQLFHALSDETRLRIVEKLLSGDQCVCNLTDALDAGQSRLSFHLKALKDAGLVTDRREGRWIYYTLNGEALAELERFAIEVKDRASRLLGKECCVR